MMNNRRVLTLPLMAAITALALLVPTSASAAPPAPARDMTPLETWEAVSRIDDRPPAGELLMTDTTLTAAGVKVVLPTTTSVTSSPRRGIRVLKEHARRFVVKSTSDGAQVYSVITARTSDHTARYSFPGRFLTQEPGGVVAVREESATGRPVALIDAPWAKDSRGNGVETHFIIENHETLIQVVNPRGDILYPLVADPRVRSAWYGTSIDFTREETEKLAVGLGGCAAIAALAAIPSGGVAAAVAAACGTLSWVARDLALPNGRCLSIKVLPTFAVVWWIPICYR